MHPGCNVRKMIYSEHVRRVYDNITSIQFHRQVCFFALLFRQTAKAEARKSLLECWCHGQAAVISLEAYDT